MQGIGHLAAGLIMVILWAFSAEYPRTSAGGENQVAPAIIVLVCSS